MTDADKARCVREAQEKIAEARREHLRLIKELFPVGSYVRWKAGPYVGAGTVMGYTLSGENLRVNDGRGRGNCVTMHAVVAMAEEQ